jgi:hypothetical protein
LRRGLSDDSRASNRFCFPQEAASKGGAESGDKETVIAMLRGEVAALKLDKAGMQSDLEQVACLSKAPLLFFPCHLALAMLPKQVVVLRTRPWNAAASG